MGDCWWLLCPPCFQTQESLKTCEDDKERKMKELQSQTELVMLGTAGVVKIGNAGGSSAAIRQRFISHTPRKGLQEASKSGAADGAEIATLRAEKALNHKSNLVFGALLILLPVLISYYNIISKLYQNYICISWTFEVCPVHRTQEELQKAAAEVPVLKKSLAEVEGAISGASGAGWSGMTL